MEKEKCAHTKLLKTEAKTEQRCFHAVTKKFPADLNWTLRSVEPSAKQPSSQGLLHQQLPDYLALIDASHPFFLIFCEPRPKKYTQNPLYVFRASGLSIFK